MPSKSRKNAWIRTSTPKNLPTGKLHPRMVRLYAPGSRVWLEAEIQTAEDHNQRRAYTSLMRVIAGTFRSRLLVSPRGTATRPTSDRLRETLFNILAARIEGCLFADLYAGTGAVGIEAISRGAAQCLVRGERAVRPRLDPSKPYRIEDHPQLHDRRSRDGSAFYSAS